jgi:DnaA-homolog protein
MQLILQLALSDDATFDNFIVGANKEVVSLLKNSLHASGDRQFHLYGDGICGRTHLLQACCQQMRALNRRAIYIPCKRNTEFSTDLLSNLQDYDLVCLDDIDAIAQAAEWEEALFYLYNTLHDANCLFITTARQAPIALPFQLADLQSRIAWGLALQLYPLSDDDKQQLLCLRAHNRGMLLSPELAQYILKHYSRDVAFLLTILDKLDRVSLQQQRRLTIPFVKSVLASV